MTNSSHDFKRITPSPLRGVKEGYNNAVIGKVPSIHADLRGKSVRMVAAPEKGLIFHNGQSL